MQYNSRKWYNDFSRVRSEESAMKLSKDIVLEYMQNQALNHSESISFTTQELSDALQMQRSNLSKLLNELVKDQRIKKTNGRPVYYSLVNEKDGSCFNNMIGHNSSLKQVIQLTKAALLYPGNSLPILITGSDGSGKSLLASLIYEFAKEAKIIDKEAPLVKINCRYLTEETDNKMRDVFFSKSSGAIDRAEGGILFIDHINRLSSDVQRDLLKCVEIGQMNELRCKLNRWNSRHQMIFRQFVSDVEVITLDGNGRFLIPKRYLKLAKIQQDVRFIGLDDTIEIWSKEIADKPFITPEDFGKELEEIMGTNNNVEIE